MRIASDDFGRCLVLSFNYQEFIEREQQIKSKQKQIIYSNIVICEKNPNENGIELEFNLIILKFTKSNSCQNKHKLAKVKTTHFFSVCLRPAIRLAMKKRKEFSAKPPIHVKNLFPTRNIRFVSNQRTMQIIYYRNF